MNRVPIYKNRRLLKLRQQYKKLFFNIVKQYNQDFKDLLAINVMNAKGDIILQYKNKMPIIKFSGYTGWVTLEKNNYIKHGVIPNDYVKKIDTYLRNNNLTKKTLIKKFNTLLDKTDKLNSKALNDIKDKYDKQLKSITVDISREIIRYNDNFYNMEYKNPIHKAKMIDKVYDNFYNEFIVKSFDKYFTRLRDVIDDGGDIDQNIIYNNLSETEEVIDLNYRTSNTYSQFIITNDKFDKNNIKSYIWHSVEDVRVRPRHKEYNGRTYQYGISPVENGKVIFPGEDWGCRCFAEPIL